MELIFCYIEDYFSIQKQSFLFNGDFEITISQISGDRTISISRIKKTISDDFFGKGITSVNAIVGENGAGKTTFLRFFHTFIGNPRAHSVVVFNNGKIGNKESFTIITDKKHKYKCEGNPHLYEIQHKTFNESGLRLKEFISSIYFSNALNLRDFWGSEYSKNISVTHKLENAKNKSPYNKLNITHKEAFQIQELQDQLKFLEHRPGKLRFKFEASLDKIGFHFPFQLDEEYTLSKLKAVEEFNNYSSQFTKDERFEERSLDKKKFILILLITNSFSNGELKDFNPFAKLLKDLSLDNFITKLSTSTELNNSKFPETLDNNPFINLINFVLNLEDDELFCTMSGFPHITDDFFGNMAFTQFEITREKALDFIKYYELTTTNNNYIRFHWNLSTGENALLSFFSDFFATKELILKDKKPLLIFLDEAELYLHPQWQKDFVNMVVEYLPVIFPKTKIQILFTSHSPFILSDIPKSRILFLEKKGTRTIVSDLNSHKETFGSNFAQLFTDAFFIKNGLMSSLSLKKIKKALKLTSKKKLSNSDKKYLEEIIHILGEPILKDILIEKYKKHNPNVRN